MCNQRVLAAAKHLLLKNLQQSTVQGQTYRRILPSREYYVHQWKWDAAIHSMALVHFDEALACDELIALVAGQWQNGFIGHITFTPGEHGYFPGPQFWGTEQFSQNGIITSGITQPPLLAIAVLYVYLRIKDQKRKEFFLKKLLPAVERYHNYLKIFRDDENSGLLTMIHPWESGTDNSPRWDRSLQAIRISDIPQRVIDLVRIHRVDDQTGKSTHRPSDEDYYRYMYLVDIYKKWHWDGIKITRESPFAVKDMLFNAIWCHANDALAQLLFLVGRDKYAEVYKQWARQTRQALAACWDENMSLFTDLDVANGKKVPIKENTIATFGPFLAKAVNQKILSSLLGKLTDSNQYWAALPLPSTACNSEKFELTRYWRGPTLPMTNFLIIEGLQQYQDNPQCLLLRDMLIKKTTKMIEDFGFFEYYNPLYKQQRKNRTASGIGFGSFSWTAAVYIYLVYQYGVSFAKTAQ